MLILHQEDQSLHINIDKLIKINGWLKEISSYHDYYFKNNKYYFFYIYIFYIKIYLFYKFYLNKQIIIIH